jgi:hypothetical protein
MQAKPRKPVKVLACPVLRDLIEPRLAGTETSVVYLDYGLHVQPKRMAPSLQKELDALEEPSLVLIGYGLCGNGLEGLEAGRHTLVIPRADDCITILLGSHQAYARAQQDHPGTYYLTRGWLEVGANPLAEYQALVERFGRENADHVVDALFGSYTSLCLLASTDADLAACRAEAREIADFCSKRWGMSYQERIGSDLLLRGLLDAPQRMGSLGEDFVVVPPGGRVKPQMFLRS